MSDSDRYEIVEDNVWGKVHRFVVGDFGITIADSVMAEPKAERVFEDELHACVRDLEHGFRKLWREARVAA